MFLVIRVETNKAPRGHNDMKHETVAYDVVINIESEDNCRLQRFIDWLTLKHRYTGDLQLFYNI